MRENVEKRDVAVRTSHFNTLLLEKNAKAIVL